MSWRNPRYCYLHAGRDAGASAISCANTFSSTGPADFLIDDRAGSLTTFTAVADDHYIQWDRGSGSLDEIDRMIIPNGHNMSGLILRVRSSSTSDFSSDVDTLVDSITCGTTLIDEDTDVSSTDRYIRMDWPGETGINPAIGEVFFTATQTTTRGPEPEWPDYLRHNTLDFEKESGAIASLALGADRRYIEYVYRNVDSTYDLAVFSELIEICGTSKPFYLDPCFDTETVIWMKLTRDSEQTLDRVAGDSPPSFRPRIPLAMLEHLA